MQLTAAASWTEGKNYIWNLVEFLLKNSTNSTLKTPRQVSKRGEQDFNWKLVAMCVEQQ